MKRQREDLVDAALVLAIAAVLLGTIARLIGVGVL